MTRTIPYSKIEQEVGINFPQDLINYYEQNVYNKGQSEEVEINCKHLINDWKYDFNFVILKSEETILNLSRFITNMINVKALCFAWSYDSVEKDTGLFYLEDGKIYPEFKLQMQLS